MRTIDNLRFILLSKDEKLLIIDDKLDKLDKLDATYWNKNNWQIKRFYHTDEYIKLAKKFGNLQRLNLIIINDFNYKINVNPVNGYTIRIIIHEIIHFLDI